MKRCESCGAPPSAKAVAGVCLVADPFEDEFCAYCGSRFCTLRPMAQSHSQLNFMAAMQRQQAIGMQNVYGAVSPYAGVLGASGIAQAFGGLGGYFAQQSFGGLR